MKNMSLSIQYVVASHNPAVLNQNFLKSKVKNVIIQTGYTNIPKAYNEANPKADLVVYAHHDIYLPEDWEKQMLIQVKKIKDWDVLGVAGVIDNGDYKDRIRKGWLMDRGNEWGSPEGLPARVDTLDECLLITNGKIKFDENLKFHFYGADICLGRRAYAIKAFCYHNSGNSVIWETEQYQKDAQYMIKKHNSFITTCGKYENTNHPK
jgi:hypothetical protein